MHPSGLLSKTSPQFAIKESLARLSQDSRASRSPLLASALARKMSGICSVMLFESLLTLEPALSSSKTSLDSLHLQPIEATAEERTWVERQINLFAPLQSVTFLDSWPKAGLMRAGQIWGQRTLASHTDVNDGGVSLGGADWATPKASPSGADFARVGREGSGGDDLETQLRKQPWSTPKTVAGDYTRDGGEKGQERLTLSGEAKLWSTPTTSDNKAVGPAATEAMAGQDIPKHHQRLRNEAAQWATPIQSDAKGSVTLEHSQERLLESSRGVRLPEQVMRVEQNLDRLNPWWEELLMGWPIGWTDPDLPLWDAAFPGPPAGQGVYQFPYEPPRTVHRDQCPNRTKRVSAIGNGVCTPCVEAAYYMLMTESVR